MHKGGRGGIYGEKEEEMEHPIPKMSQNSNMNELLKQKTQLDLNLPFCICCLIQNGPFISISLCVHADFLNTYPILKESTQLKKIVCEDCHLLMTKIYKFKLQIEETCNFLSNKIDYIDKLEQRKKKLSRSNIVYNDIPAINKNIESQEDENSNKIKNIETALTILNNNATSLESCDLKSMTEVLFQMTANTLNLESSKVLPDKKKNRNRDAMLSKFESVPNINMNVLPVDVKEKSEYIINELLKNTEEVANFDRVTKKLPVEKNETVTVATMKRNSEIIRSDSGPKTLADDSNYDNIASTSQAFLPIKLNKNQLLKEREEKMKSADFLRWPYRCEQCVIGFRYKENLKFHKRHHQKRNGFVTCEICLQYVQDTYINEHTERHYNRLQCDKCKKIFALSDEAYQHYEDVHSLETLKRKSTRRDLHKDVKRNKNSTDDTIRDTKTVT